jgi:hypothetical protein
MPLPLGKALVHRLGLSFALNAVNLEVLLLSVPTWSGIPTGVGLALMPTFFHEQPDRGRDLF